MLGFKFIWVIVVALITANSNVSKTTVVLVPDHDGHVGEVSVSNKSGSRILSKAYTAIRVKSESEITNPTTISETETKNLFASALAAQPKAANQFILYFNSGASELTSESKEKLNQIINIIKQSEIIDIYINGHTDTKGSEELNYKLALKRATFVEDMIKEKVTTTQIANIRTHSHGEGNPLVKTADNVNEPKNRRVEVTIHL